jgi:hypothetical protein
VIVPARRLVAVAEPVPGAAVVDDVVEQLLSVPRCTDVEVTPDASKRGR